MVNDPFYVDLDKKERNRVMGFLITCILRSRGETHFTSNSRGFDEDVNVYLAHLLLCLLDPRFVERVQKYVLKRDQDIFRLVEDSGDSAFKQVVYRVNADHLLVSIGLFDNLGTSFKERRAFYGRSRRSYVGQGKTYYRFAASYGREAGGRFRHLVEVLAKLSEGFEEYVDVLSALRRDYLHLLHERTPDAFDHLRGEIGRFERELDWRRKTDEFLDLYVEWKRRGDPRSKEALLRKAGEIRALDPGFRYEPS